jgi:hypothetical protein
MTHGAKAKLTGLIMQEKELSAPGSVYFSVCYACGFLSVSLYIAYPL